MAEKDKIFSSKIKYGGIFNFGEFYKFCYEWVRDEMGFSSIVEEKYAEKLSGDSKNIDIEWSGSRTLTDYFKAEIKISFRVIGLTQTEISYGNRKIKTNKGSVEVSIKGTLVKDPQGNFEKDAIRKFLRGIYEKTVIPTRVSEYSDKILKDCDEFLAQAKAYLDLEGKK